MSRGGDASKALEAQALVAEADKAVKTGLFKRSADWAAAEPALARAASLFKAAGMLDSAQAAWRRAADAALKMGNVKKAVVTLETAARELLEAGGAAAPLPPAARAQASALLAEAAGLLYEAGEPPRAADLKLRAGKLLETQDPKRAEQLYDEAASMFDGDTDKDVYAKDALSKVLTHQLALGKHASAMRTMDRLAGVFLRLNQPHNLVKLILSRVVLLLAAADPVAAQREFDRQLDAPGFASAPEAAAAEDLLAAYGEMNPDAVKAVVERNVFNYLDNAITRIAKGLPASVSSGQAIGSAAGEAATKGVTHAPSTAASSAAALGLPDGWKVVGGGGGGYGSSASAAATGGADASDPLARAAARAAEKDGSARAALFSRPSGGAPGGGADAGAEYGGAVTRPKESPPPARAPAPAPAPAPSAADAADGEDDFDFDKAIGELDVGADDGKAAADDEDLGML